jgi:SAM-dependent methyltransferase
MASDKALRYLLTNPGKRLSSEQPPTGFFGSGTGLAAPAGRSGGPASPYGPGAGHAGSWAGRQYEHRAEVMALARLLHGHRFSHAVDVGGGYGRISVTLRRYAEQVTVAEPSIRQLELAEQYLQGHPGIETRLMDAAHLDFEDASVDLAVMIRLLRHLPDPADALSETARILKPGGYAVIEAANILHVVNRLRCLISRKATGESPAATRAAKLPLPGRIPYVNHHPERLMLQLAVCGLRVERVLSVSNLRSPLLKRVVPERLMLAAEYFMQVPLAPVYFGPSLFFLARKHDLADDRPYFPAMTAGPARATEPAGAGPAR